ncbi:MAG TPA: glycosyltransferase family 4 protein [Thermoanaerobaculia bacterium]|nr:glycosyltransferase family 4 protein [Thermoanaerobaculia bacterium]
MKIVVLYQYFGGYDGAWSSRWLEFGRRWAGEGHHVTVITGRYYKCDMPEGGDLVVEGIHVRVLPVELTNKEKKAKRLIAFLNLMIRATGMLLLTDADIVVASSGPLTMAVPAMFKNLFGRTPYVFETRDLWPDTAIATGHLQGSVPRFLARWLERAAYAGARHVIALSPAMRDAITRRSATPVTVIPNACDVSFWSRPVLAAERAEIEAVVGTDTPFFVYAGNVGPTNAHEKIIEAARMLHEQGRTDIRIVVIGDGAGSAQVEEASRQFPNLVAMGLRPKKDVVPWLALARGSLITFESSGVMNAASPNKFFDSLAAGTPVIQNTTGWLADLVSHEDLGLNVAPDSGEGLAQAMITLTDDDERVARNRGNAQRLAKRFDRDLLSGQYLGVLREVVDATGP